MTLTHANFLFHTALTNAMIGPVLLTATLIAFVKPKAGRALVFRFVESSDRKLKSIEARATLSR